MKFTAKSLEALKPSTVRPQEDYWDQDLSSFGLRVSKSGRKTWNVMYPFRGTLRRMKIGPYGIAGLSLAEARSKAKEVLHEAAKGLDPATLKKEDRLAESFSDLVERYLDWAEKNKSSWREDKRILHKDVLPYWKNRKAKEIVRSDVIKLIDRIVDRGAPVHANRALALVRRVFNFGIEKDIAQYNPCQAVKKPTKERPKDRVLSFDEIRILWIALDSENLIMSSIVKLQLLTAQRPGEVRRAEWTEIDLESEVWTIPNAKAKNGLTHRVPLNDMAVKLLKNLKSNNPSSKWVFPSFRSTDGHIENIQKFIGRMRNKTGIDFAAHDLRRTAISCMTSQGVPRLVASKILNHVESGVIRVYDRHSYDSEKRQALDLWGNILRHIIDPNTLKLAANF